MALLDTIEEAISFTPSADAHHLISAFKDELEHNGGNITRAKTAFNEAIDDAGYLSPDEKTALKQALEQAVKTANDNLKSELRKDFEQEVALRNGDIEAAYRATHEAIEEACRYDKATAAILRLELIRIKKRLQKT